MNADESQLIFWQQALRFLSFEDGVVRIAVLGALLLGCACGLVGSFMVVRKLSLFGDTLSHAVLPGVALGFMWNMSKDPWTIFIGAVIAGLAGVAVVQAITRTTHLKEDSAMAMVLAGFYGLGICLLTWLQHSGTGEVAGLDKMLFGQIVALSSEDVWLMAIILVIAGAILFVFYKQYLVLSFDPGFAFCSGIPARLFNGVLMLLLAFTIVAGLQAVGVVLISALLITPAATAYLWTNRFHHMIFLSCGFGMLAGFAGTFVSFLKGGLPTGPFIVLAATLVFVSSWLAAPLHGWVPRHVRNWKRRRRVAIENVLKHIYQLIEQRGPVLNQQIRLRELNQRRNEPLPDSLRVVRQLVRQGLAEWVQVVPAGLHETGGLAFVLTESGHRRAQEQVRNHRLWELYLNQAASYPMDHVHEDAEEMEHLLSAATIERLQRRLAHPTLDPHGKAIPQNEREA